MSKKEGGKEKGVERDELMRKLQEVSFAMVELNLYLDTHPWDHQALGDLNSLSHQYQMLTYEYEKHFGPLKNHGHSMSPHPWKWVEPPWPWQL